MDRGLHSRGRGLHSRVLDPPEKAAPRRCLFWCRSGEMPMRHLSIAVSCLVLFSMAPGPAEGPQRMMTTATDLVAQPDGQRVAVLLPGAVLHAVETRDGWTRVSMEG